MTKELLAEAYELAYITTVCPQCGCVLGIPTGNMLHLTKSWVCPRCGQLYITGVGIGYWTEDQVTLALDANRFIEQQALNAQISLDRFLKTHDDMGIKFTSGSLTGRKNDLVIAEVFATRDCREDSRIWTGIKEDMTMLLIYIKQNLRIIEDLIVESYEESNGAD